MPPESAPSEVARVAAQVPPPTTRHVDGITGVGSMDDPIEKRLDDIEMIGEEEAAFANRVHSEVTAGMRYLHCSRTIHQLVTDRNRAVGLYLAVATLLWTASSALLSRHADAGTDDTHLIFSLLTIQRWCLPATFATLTVLAFFVGFLLIRTRIGLIYEVAKMNVLLGLPVGRVQRVNPLSIFFIMHALISLAGGCCAGALAAFLLKLAGFQRDPIIAWASVTAVTITLFLLLLYIATVRYTTADEKLRDLKG